MELLFIRHAKAIDRIEWDGDDLLRPLSEEGIKKAREFFKKLPKIYQIEVIISSKATRAIQTAELLKEVYPNVKYFETSKLNPGADPLAYEQIVEKFRGYGNIAMVGHEPDIGLAVASLLGCEELPIKIRKASVTHLSGEETFELHSMIYPKLLKGVE